MKTIPLTQGKFAMVDDEDYPMLSAHKWCLGKSSSSDGQFCAYRRLPGPRNGPQRHITMHVQIMGKRKGMEVDHWNRDGLDNQRRNLRWATRQQNQANTEGRAGSGFKGVTRRPSSGRFYARIKVNYLTIRLGTYDTAQEAARAYNEAALHYFGEFAWLNPV